MGKKRVLSIMIVLMLMAAESHAREFLNSFLHLNFGFSYGFTQGSLISHEHNSLTYVYLNSGFSPTHFDLSYNFFVDFMPIPPLILGDESNALKFGIRGRYNNNTIRQKLTVTISSSDKLTFEEDFLKYSSWMVGPVIYFAPIINSSDLDESYSAGGGFTIFALFGQVIEGKIHPFPIKRKIGETVSAADNLSIRGFRMDFGFGAAISICSINMGMNFFYSILNFTTRYPAYETMGRSYTVNEFCIEVYIGIPIEWSRFPIIF